MEKKRKEKSLFNSRNRLVQQRYISWGARSTRTDTQICGGGGWKAVYTRCCDYSRGVERVRRRNTLWSTAFTDIPPISILANGRSKLLNPAESRQEGVRLPRHVNTERINFRRVHIPGSSGNSLGRIEKLRLDFVTAIFSVSIIVPWDTDFFFENRGKEDVICCWRSDHPPNSDFFLADYNVLILFRRSSEWKLKRRWKVLLK